MSRSWGRGGTRDGRSRSVPRELLRGWKAHSQGLSSAPGQGSPGGPGQDHRDGTRARPEAPKSASGLLRLGAPHRGGPEAALCDPRLSSTDGFLLRAVASIVPVLRRGGIWEACPPAPPSPPPQQCSLCVPEHISQGPSLGTKASVTATPGAWQVLPRHCSPASPLTPPFPCRLHPGP